MNSRAEGFTLVEILIVTLLSAIVMGSIYQMIVMQDRTTREQYAIVETQQNARTALAIMTSDLKEISSVAGDVVAATNSSITFRALRKAAISCNKSGANDYLDVHELGGAFAVGDSVFVFAEGANANSANDDTWLTLRVSNVAALTVASCANMNPFNATAWRRIYFNASPLANVATAGALVRSFDHTRYRIVDSGEWGQLMRTEGSNAEVAIIERLAASADEGLRLRYFNSAGTQIADNALAANLANIMRVQVKVRGKSVSQVSQTGSNRYQDSLVTTVYMRGNYRTQ
jgi:prepilin-type N-terminal cleavage/methylation domain-containing protein